MLKGVAKGLAAVAAACAKVAPTVLRDACGLAGAGSIAYGAWLMYPPAGFISAGVLALVGVVFASIAPKA